MKSYHCFSRIFMAKCLLLFLVFLVFPTSSFSTPGKVIDVDITQPWTDTGVDITSSEFYLIKTFGVYQLSGTWPPPHGMELLTPAGKGYAGESPYTNLSWISIIGKIGSAGVPFYIGEYKAFTADASGRLYIGINDHTPADNIGYCSAVIFKLYDWSGAVDSGTPPNLPQSSSLNQNYPNPFNPNTTINYSVQTPGFVKIKIYNSIGQLVRTLVDEYRVTGNYSCLWDGTDNSGAKVASGTYYYQMETNGYDSAKQMILLK